MFNGRLAGDGVMEADGPSRGLRLPKDSASRFLLMVGPNPHGTPCEPYEQLLAPRPT